MSERVGISRRQALISGGLAMAVPLYPAARRTQGTMPLLPAARQVPRSRRTQTVFGLSPGDQGVWRYNGSGMSWTRVGGPASAIYDGGYAWWRQRLTATLALLGLGDGSKSADPAQHSPSPATRCSACRRVSRASTATTARACSGPRSADPPARSTVAAGWRRPTRPPATSGATSALRTTG